MSATIEIGVSATVQMNERSLFARIVAAELRPLASVSTLLQETARSMVKPAERKNPRDLTPAEHRVYLITKRLPTIPSRPGEPPRSPTGKYRNSIVGVVNPRKPSAITGIDLDIGADLEFGSRAKHIAPRPALLPALNRNLSAIPSLFEGMLN